MNKLLILFLMIFCYLGYTDLSYGQTFSCDNADSMVEKMEKLMRGNTNISEMDMLISTKRWKRKINMESWSEGKDKSFIRINYPKKDKGITFLKMKNEMWQYVPKIERIIKIPPSMMLQSWMGSDFTNDDLVKESSLTDDYTKKLLNSSGNSCFYELLPKEDAPVVWGKIIVEMANDTFVPIKVAYYDDEKVLIRDLIYSDIKKLSDRYFPMRWEMIPYTENKKGHKTLILIKKVMFNVKIENSIFTLRALKRMSR